MVVWLFVFGSMILVITKAPWHLGD